MEDQARDSGVREDDIAKALGYLVLATARAERLLGMLQVNLLGSDLGREVLLGQPWERSAQACRVLAAARRDRLEHGADRTDFDGYAAALTDVPGVLKTASDLMQNRNALIHGAITFPSFEDDDNMTVSSWVNKSWGREDNRDWTIAGIDKLTGQIEQVADEIGRLADLIGKAV